MQTTRRKFLGATGLAAAGFASIAACGRRAAPAAGSLARFACNMESWWTDLEFMSRFERAAETGFTAIEFWQHDLPGRDVTKIAAHCRSLNLDVVQFTGWGGPSLADPAFHDAFVSGMNDAVEVAAVLDAPMFTVVGHQVVEGIDHAASLGNIEKALARVAPALEAAGKVAILEPFNPVDHQGHFLNGSADALRICRSIASPAIKINWDLYHMQMTEGNLVASMREGVDQIGYVQIADVPGRHQPGTGELDYGFIFNALDSMGYEGPIGLEFWPADGDEAKAVHDLVAASNAKHTKGIAR